MAVDIPAPANIHLGPLLVAAPAFTATIAGPRLTASIGALAVAAQVSTSMARGVLDTENLEAQIAALVLVSVLTTVFCLLRGRRDRQLEQTRSVAEVAQHVLLRPMPRRSGPLEIDSFYLAAEDEAEMGGDLLAAARTVNSTRVLIGDVRGKGLPAYSQAALLLGAFRAAAHRQATLTRLAIHLDGAIRWDTSQWTADRDLDTDESFATLILLDVPDEDWVVHAIHCGHPPALLLRRGTVTPCPTQPADLPVGLGGFAATSRYHVEALPFDPGDLLLLYTDGVTEARDDTGDFYPLAERATAWTKDSPHDLIAHLREDLLAHAHGGLGDDAAAVAIRRRPT